MKQNLVIISALVILSSCHFTKGSGVIISEKRSTGSFKGVSVSGGFEVELRNGPQAEVTVEADDNIMKYIETRVSGDVLKIGLKDLHNFGEIHLKAFVTAPEFSKITASGGADVESQDVLKNDGRMAINCSGGGSIRADLDAPDVEAEASSGSSLHLSGRTKSYHGTVSSGADMQAGDLLSESTTVTASSGASAYVHASVNLNANASSGGSVRYRGGASVQKNTSSGGSVEKE